MHAQQGLLTLVANFPYIPPSPRRSGRSDPGGDIVAVGVAGLVLALALFAAVAALIGLMRRRRQRAALRALSRRPSPDARCMLAGKVTGGDVALDPIEKRSSVWFEVTLFPSNPNPDDEPVEHITLSHQGRCELSCDDAIVVVDTKHFEALHLPPSLRHLRNHKLPAWVSATLDERNAPTQWSSGHEIEWVIDARVIRVGDTLTVIGTTKAAPDATVTSDASASESATTNYREAPAHDPHHVWRVSSGPLRGAPVLTTVTPEKFPEVMYDSVIELDPEWFTRA